MLFHVLMQTRLNILRYHLIEAKVYNLKRSELIELVSYASAPILATVSPQQKKKIKHWQKYDLEEVVKLYAGMDSEKEMQEHLQSKYNKALQSTPKSGAPEF